MTAPCQGLSHSMLAPELPLWAVHISDGVLDWPWLVGGFVVAGLLAFVGAWRIRDEEVPRVAVMASAFFVASLIHVKVASSSVHLLLNGLVGVTLGRRAALAIPVGLFLQVLLIGHGGFSTLGINSCIMVLPALLAWWLFRALHQVSFLRHPWFRVGMILVVAPVGMLSLVYTLALLISNLVQGPGSLNRLDTTWADQITLHPALLVAVLALGVIAALLQRKLETAPEFALGLLLGGVTVLATVLLNAVVLLFGSLRPDAGPPLALVMLVLHLPVVAVEGVIFGFTLGFLARVKPEMLGLKMKVAPAESKSATPLLNGTATPSPATPANCPADARP